MHAFGVFASMCHVLSGWNRTDLPCADSLPSDMSNVPGEDENKYTPEERQRIMKQVVHYEKQRSSALSIQQAFAVFHWLAFPSTSITLFLLLWYVCRVTV